MSLSRGLENREISDRSLDNSRQTAIRDVLNGGVG